MAYTAPTMRAKLQTNNFSGMRNDGNRVAMQFGNYMQTIDATGTPVTSPATVNTTQTLVCPTGAIQFTVSPVTNAVQVSEDSTQTAYFSVPAGTTYTFDVANMKNVYLKTGSSTVVSFYFSIM